MKVLQINNVYNFGSTGKITRDIHQTLLREGVESLVCYGRRYKTDDKGVIKVCSEVYGKANNLLSRITGIPYGGCHLSTNKLIRIIRKEKPDVVHLQCLNGFFVNIYRLIEFLKQEQISTVLTLHAEFMHTANCGHAYDCEKWKTGCGNCPNARKATGSYFFDRTHHSWIRMKKAFEGFEKLTVVSVSPWLMERAQHSPILADKNHVTIYNGLDTSIFHPYDTQELRRALGIQPDEKVIFHATPSFSLNPDHIKGGYYIRELAERMKKDNVKIVVAGPAETDEQLPENMIMLGRVADQKKMAQLYSLADVTVLTSKRETFSMVCAESLCCGTPVVGFKAGAPEQISLKECSEFCEYEDVDGLIAAVAAADWSGETTRVAVAAQERYSREAMVEKYIKIYCEMKGD